WAAGRGVRARPWTRVRPGPGRRRPAGRPGQHHRTDGPPRGPGQDQVVARRRHRGTTGDGDMNTDSAGNTDPSPPPSRRLRVVLFDDHAMFRSGVKAEIGDAVDVVGEGHDVVSAVETIRNARPDV